MTVGNTKAWVDTKTNGQKELSLAGHTHSYAASSHTHTKSQITDFPTTMTPSAHTHAASDISSGVLGAARGGTGHANTITSAGKYAIMRKAGDGDYMWYTNTASGAFYATGANTNAKFGTLPVAQGGTGVTTLAALKTALGIPSSITSQEILTGTLTIKSSYGHSCSYSMPTPSTTWKSFAVEIYASSNTKDRTGDGIYISSSTATKVIVKFTDTSTSTFTITLSGSAISCSVTEGESSPSGGGGTTTINLRFTGNI